MIGRLRGILQERAPDGCCVIDVGGVGYEVHVPASTAPRLAAPPAEVVLFVHTHVREDALTLYGFDAMRDREAFRKLLSVSSVGPRMAMAILGAMPAAGLAQAVARKDRARFKGISGVGPKTVDRILLELGDKLDNLAGSSAPAVPGAQAASQSDLDPLSQVAAALMQMGYKRTEAAQAVASVAVDIENKPVETLLREALAALA